MPSMKALILAGGKGTRLGKQTGNLPKPLIKIGRKPILEYQIELLKKHGFKDAVLLIGHLGRKIKKYFGNGEKWGLNISYLEEDMPLGTAGGVKTFEKNLDGDFLLIYGDLLPNVDLSRFIERHNENKKRSRECIGTLATHPNSHPLDSDLLEVGEDNKITRFISKPHPENLLYNNVVNAALYALSPEICEYIQGGAAADFGKDIFPAVLKKQKHALYAYSTPEYIRDIGTPDRLRKAKKDVKSGWYYANVLSIKKPAVFLDRDGVINKEVDRLASHEDFELIEGAAEAIKKLNESGTYVVVATNQPAIAKGFCKYEDVLLVHKKMETELGKFGAKLDGIYFCPHHPEKGFPGENPDFKKICDCRKPAIGMLQRAARDFNIDLKNSFFVGDSTADAAAAKNAGTEFVGVSTGYGCKDAKYQVSIPKTSIKKDLLAAANYIIKKTQDGKNS